MKFHIVEYDYAGDTWAFEIQAGDSVDDAKARLKAIARTGRLSLDEPYGRSLHSGIIGFFGIGPWIGRWVYWWVNR